MTPSDPAEEARRNHAAMYPKKAAKRRGATPEAKVKREIDAYLKRIGAINIRTNAGSWQGENGNWIQGAKAGTSDNIACIAGVFCAIEAKSATGKISEAQARFLARVEVQGGLAIVARGRDDVRAALVGRFGEDVVRAWETKR